MLQIALSPCSPFSVTKELLIESANFARKHGLKLHTHLAETIDEEDYCLKEYKLRPLDFMERVGWLGKDVWYAHGIHFKDDELIKLSKTGTGVAHCPTSNMRLISGTAKIREMIDIGVPVGLAVDGSASNDSSNFMREVKMALYLSRTRMNILPLTHLDVLWLATRGGAKLLGRDDLGSIEKDKAADIILYKNDTIDFAGDVHDPVASLIYCGTSDRVDISIVNGKVVVENGKLLNIDEAELREKVNIEAKRMIDATN
jgi:cytosine/adenosine deaminase-related metal-dependent hydrolase